MDLEAFEAIVPLLAVLLTAALSGCVVPRITRRWQEHQKELEIKTSLVEAISVEVLQFILAMQFAERRISTKRNMSMILGHFLFEFSVYLPGSQGALLVC